MNKLSYYIKNFLKYTPLCLGAIHFQSDAQKWYTPTQKEVSTGIYLSTSGKNPFWLRSNQYGIVPLESQIIAFRGGIYKEYQSERFRQTQEEKPQVVINDSTLITNTPLKKYSTFRFGYGLSVVGNVGKVNQILLPEAYIKARYGVFEVYGGRRKEIVGLVDTTLTSGSYIWSGNALPLPKVQISIPNYTSIIGKGLISIKGAYSHGWFDNGYVKNFYLHQKWVYGKLGKDNWKVNFYAGFNHQVQWGGKPTTPYIESSTGRLITHYPTGWKTYLQVVTGISLNRNGNSLEQEGVPLNEALNRAGNHLGTVDIGGELKVKTGRILLYRQSIYEDGSLFYLNNITDGLFGISYKHFTQKNVSKFKLCSIGFEYLNTNSQGGIGGSGSTIPELRGQDNYFNNSLYTASWTYLNNTIGSPFMLPLRSVNQDVLSKSYPINTIQSYIVDNRVSSKVFTIVSQYEKITALTKISFTDNLGKYGNAINPPLKSISWLQSFIFPYKSYFILTQFAYDSSLLFGKPQAGLNIRLQKYW